MSQIHGFFSLPQRRRTHTLQHLAPSTPIPALTAKNAWSIMALRPQNLAS